VVLCGNNSYPAGALVKLHQSGVGELCQTLGPGFLGGFLFKQFKDVFPGSFAGNHFCCQREIIEQGSQGTGGIRRMAFGGQDMPLEGHGQGHAVFPPFGFMHYAPG